MKRNGNDKGARLTPDPKNARKHGERNKSLIRESLETVGPLRSIGVDGDNIIRAGNGVYDQAQALGLKVRVVDAKPNELIAVRRPDLKGKRAIEAALYDNRAGEVESTWNTDVLAEIAERDGDLLRRMFEGDKDVLAAIGPQEQADAEPEILIDRAEELQEKWRVKLGEVFRMGEHFVICGDCREPDTWKRLLGAAGVGKVNGVFTSPPYAEQRKKQYGGVPTGKYVEWWEAVQANIRANLAGDGSFFVNIKPHCEDGERVLYVFDLVLAMRRKWEWRFIDELEWKHQGYPGGWNNRFKNQFEPIYHFSVGDVKFRPDQVLQELGERHYYHIQAKKEGRTWTGDNYHHPNSKSGFGNMKYYNEDLQGARPGNVLEFNTGANSNQAASFPTELVNFFISAYSDEGDTWLDPFCGSGTTIVAAANNKRRGLGIEALPKYCAVICERMTQTFPDLEIERLNGSTQKSKAHHKRTQTAARK